MQRAARPKHQAGADFLSQGLPLSSQASALDFTKSLGSAQEGDDSNESDDRQRLEKIPADVVEVEYQLHGDDGSEENAMRDRGSRERLLEVCNISAEDKPLSGLLVFACPHNIIYDSRS
jgi:hypothetical protein